MSDSPKIKITAHRGSLWVSPLPLLGFLKPSFQYDYKYTPTEEYSYKDKLGIVRTGKRRTSRIEIAKTNMFVERENQMVLHEGMYSRLVSLLTRQGFEVEYSKINPQFPSPTLDASVIAGLHPDQAECVISILSSVGAPGEPGGSGAMAEMTMGAGKTYVIAALCRAYRTKVVITTKKKRVVRRLFKGMSELLAGTGITVGMYQGSTRIDGDVVICTSVLLKYFDEDDVGVLIFDECHHGASDSMSESILRLTASIKIGLSATITDRFDGKDLLLEGIFGPIVYTLDDEAAEELGRVAPIKGYMLQVSNGPLIGSINNPSRKEKLAIWRNAFRNQLAVDVVAATPDDQQLLIFVKTREHGEILLEVLPEGFEFYHGGLTDKKQDDIADRFESGELKRIIATDSLGEGVDPDQLMVVIDMNWNTSNIEIPQRIGRNRRHADGKGWGVFVGFYDDFDLLPRKKSKTRLANYRSRGYNITCPASVEQIEFVERQQLISSDDLE